MRANAQIQTLEIRRLLAANPPVLSGDGYLDVSGTPDNDSITIKLKPNDSSVVQVIINNETFEYDKSQLNGASIGGSEGNDAISIDAGVTLPATIFGNDGDDIISPGGGNDVVDGGAGNDTLDYSDYSAKLTSESEFKITSEIAGIDTYSDVEILLCGSGDDFIDIVSVGSYLTNLNYIDGGPGNDDISFFYDSLATSAPTVHGGNGNDTLSVNPAGLLGESDGEAFYFGDVGNDLFLMRRYWGNRTFSGGAGIDTVNYGIFNTAGGMLITLDDQPGDGPSGFDNVHSDIEVVYGSMYDDTIVGTSRDETLVGSIGDDSLVGNGGNDVLDQDWHDYPPPPDAPLPQTPPPPAATLSAVSVTNGRLKVTGTSNGDQVLVRRSASDRKRIEILLGGKVVGRYLFTRFSSLQIDTGNGNDRVKFDASLGTAKFGCTINGGAGNDSLYGSANADKIHGGDGNDSISGMAGNDSMWGDAGDDRVCGDDGNDYLCAGVGRDMLRGRGGVDRIIATLNIDDVRDNKGDKLSNVIE